MNSSVAAPRPGEKLYEDLFYPAEDLADTPHPRIHIARQTVPLDREQLAADLRNLHAALQTRDREELVAALQRAVPAWLPPGNVVASQGKERKEWVGVAGVVG